MPQVRVEREEHRTCDGCGFKGRIVRVMVGGRDKAVRICGGCWSEVVRLRAKVHNEDLEGAETTR